MSQTILITGATSGIGRATALALAKRGHDVLATGRNKKALAALYVEAEGALQTLLLDVTDPQDVDNAVREVAARTGGRGLDVLVNNAGFGVMAPTSEVSSTDVRAQFETNVFGLLGVTQAFLPAMRRRGAGKIINVSSVGGRLTLPWMGSYNATKYAVESLSDALRCELHRDGIAVVLVEPGVINTNFTARSTAAVDRFADAHAPYRDALSNVDQVIARTEAMGVPPERIAQVIAKIVTKKRPRARYIAPLSATLALVLSRVLPTRWLDAILRRVAGLHRRDAPALTPATAD